VKYVLILYLCSFAGQPQCTSSSIPSVEFNSHYDCITEGYKHAYIKLKEFPVEEVNQQKLAIRFACQEVNTKPKINT